ncbi:MAG: sulfatase [Acidobacteria bacterium]|nr:sulfatase [Acidobacteriota bacterium]
MAVCCAAVQLAGCGPGDPGGRGADRAAAQRVAPLPSPSNILLITVDTLRADHLSSYGYPRRTTPNLDRLAAEGVRFDQTAVQWPKTTPSFASMFTATYSKDNDIVRKVGIPVSCRFEMLAKVLKRHGYATRAVVSNGALASEFNFDQGFDRYIETWKLTSHAGADPNHAEAVTRLAIGLLDDLAQASRARRPWFLWVHYIDPHFPYSPPGKWRDRFQGDRFFDRSQKVPISDRAKQQMGGIGREEVLDGHDDLAFYVARYDAAVAYDDAQIGVLLAAMQRRGLLGRTLTAFTADHGESLGEHAYYFDHGRFGFQTCLRVPLILHYPGVIAPRVDRQPVELLDLAPTLLEAAGVGLPGGVWKQGRSLTPRLRGLVPASSETAAGAPGAGAAGSFGAAGAAHAAGPPAAAGAPPASGGLAFSEAGWETNNKWQKAVRDGRFKLLVAQTYHEQRWIAGEGVEFALYDLAADPLETRNVADRFPRDLERLKRALWAWDRAPKLDVETDPPTPSCAPGKPKDIDPQTRALLHSLGYL